MLEGLEVPIQPTLDSRRPAGNIVMSLEGLSLILYLFGVFNRKVYFIDLNWSQMMAGIGA